MHCGVDNEDVLQCVGRPVPCVPALQLVFNEIKRSRGGIRTPRLGTELSSESSFSREGTSSLSSAASTDFNLSHASDDDGLPSHLRRLMKSVMTETSQEEGAVVKNQDETGEMSNGYDNHHHNKNNNYNIAIQSALREIIVRNEREQRYLCNHISFYQVILNEYNTVVT